MPNAEIVYHECIDPDGTITAYIDGHHEIFASWSAFESFCLSRYGVTVKLVEVTDANRQEIFKDWWF